MGAGYGAHLNGRETVATLRLIAHSSSARNLFVREPIVVSASVVESWSLTLFIKVIARDHNGYHDCDCDPPHAHRSKVNLENVKTRGIFSNRIFGLRCHYSRVLDRSRALISHDYFKLWNLRDVFC